MVTQKVREVSTEDAVFSLLGRSSPLFAELENDPEKQEKTILDSLGRLIPRTKHEQIFEINVNGVCARVVFEDFEIIRRQKLELKLSLAQTDRLRDFTKQGIDLFHPSVEDGVKKHFQKFRLDTIERKLLAEKEGIDPLYWAKKLDRPHLWNELELDELGCPKARRDQLVKFGFLEKQVKWYVNEEKRTVEKVNFYTLSRHGLTCGVNYLVDQGTPRAEIACLLNVKGRHGKVELRPKDYEIALRLNRKMEVPPSMEKRLQFLRDQGLKPESSQFQIALETHFPYGRAIPKIERQLWAQKEGIDLSVLQEINLHKQVTQQDLEVLGYKAEMLSKMEKKGLIRSQVLDIEVEPGSFRKLTYFTLKCEGKWAGVEFVVDKGIPQKEIQRWPQKRLNLLKHDLYVPRATQLVKSELESTGYKILSIKNESMQYRDVMSRLSEQEKAKLIAQHGNLRKAFQEMTFADVQFEVEDAKGQKLTVDVEYGIYASGRMEKKAKALKGNLVFVVGSKKAVAGYQKKIGARYGLSYRTINI